MADQQDSPGSTIAVTGSTGLIGVALVPSLLARGHRVVRFRRNRATLEDGTTSVSWDPDRPVEPAVFDGIDAVVHLAGENIGAKRWNGEQKKKLVESRVGPTRRLAESMAAASRPPRVLVSASAFGIYGDRGDEELDESSAIGTGFLADLCRDWEAATEPASKAGIRVVNPRIGVVLSATGGALAAQLPAFRWGAGAVLGSGSQWVSWITIQDLVRVIQHAIDTEKLVGPVNAVSPGPVTNREFGRTLARVLNRPFLFTIPPFALRLMFGEVADAAMLVSAKVKPRRLLESGFTFSDPELEPALRSLLGRS